MLTTTVVFAYNCQLHIRWNDHFVEESHSDQTKLMQHNVIKYRSDMCEGVDTSTVYTPYQISMILSLSECARLQCKGLNLLHDRINMFGLNRQAMITLPFNQCDAAR